MDTPCQYIYCFNTLSIHLEPLPYGDGLVYIAFVGGTWLTCSARHKAPALLQLKCETTTGGLCDHSIAEIDFGTYWISSHRANGVHFQSRRTIQRYSHRHFIIISPSGRNERRRTNKFLPTVKIFYYIIFISSFGAPESRWKCGTSKNQERARNKRKAVTTRQICLSGLEPRILVYNFLIKNAAGKHLRRTGLRSDRSSVISNFH
jgi:hypothetical protein